MHGDDSVTTEGGVHGLHSPDTVSPNLHRTSSPSGSKAKMLKFLSQFEGTLISGMLVV